ncbi:putative nucleotidyltransferase, ribonuclease H, partial [Tanacetum coccineum]
WLLIKLPLTAMLGLYVIFGNVRQPEFVYHGSSPLKSVKLISPRTLISHGCQGFLASVMDTSLEGPNIEDLSVVLEFADVFPDELPGLPPAREIEFGIELIPGVEPISKAPYRMIEGVKGAVTGDSEEEHEQHLRIVLEILRQKKFGIIRIHQRLRLSPKWPRPYYGDGGESFLGLAVITDEEFEELKQKIGVCSYMTLHQVLGGFRYTVMHRRKTHDLELAIRRGFFALKNLETTICMNVEDGKHTEFSVDDDGIVWFEDRLCVPNDQALREKQDVATFCIHMYDLSACQNEHQRASGFCYRPFGYSYVDWMRFSHGFRYCLPTTQKDMMRFGGCEHYWPWGTAANQSAHFLPIRKNYGISKLAEIFRQEIVRLHVQYKAISSSNRWSVREDHSDIGRYVEGLCFGMDRLLDEYLCLVEFAYNNSWHASIKGSNFELLYGRKCRAPICWDEVGERLIEGPELIEITNEKVAVAKEKLKEARSRQKSYADKHRRDLEFQTGDRVFLKVSPFRGVKHFGAQGQAQSSIHWSVEILNGWERFTYRLALPSPLLHVHEPDMSLSEEPESILDRQEEKRVMRNKVIPF